MFREETITDVLTGALFGAASHGLLVDYPNEVKTGADMEWWFVAPDLSCVRLLIQAKRSSPTTRPARARYREIKHPRGSGKQAQTLVSTARGSPFLTIPLYAFYNPQSLCTQINAKPGETVEGVNLADGYAVQHLIDQAIVLGRSTEPNLKQLRPLFGSLKLILCAVKPAPWALASRRTRRGTMGFLLAPLPGSGLAVPTPTDVLQAVGEWRGSVPDGTLRGFDWPSLGEPSPKPPSYVQRLLGIDAAADDELPSAARVVVFHQPSKIDADAAEGEYEKLLEELIAEFDESDFGDGSQQRR